jgi:hypothetical protein
MGETDARAELERHQDRLLQLPGVIGAAVGLDDAQREVIHLYVQTGTQSGDIREAAARLLAGTPFQVIHAEVPEAE